MNDAIGQFKAAMQAAGLEPPDLIEPGRFHRFPGADKHGGNTAGWCRLFEDCRGGVFGDWSTGLEGHWQAQHGGNGAMSQAEHDAFKRRVAESMAQSEETRRKQQEEAAQKAQAIWNEAVPAPDDRHPYLAKKGVKAHGVRLHGKSLVVPMCDTSGVLHSLQRIAADGNKKFMPGGRVTGCYFPIGKPDGMLCICEGFATGATIHEATGCAVAVVFTAGNLLAVAKAVRTKSPDLQLILCADDDYRTEGNPGLTKATEAALAVDGIIAVPEFGPERPDGATDFNDLAQHRGLDAVRAAIASATTPVSGEHGPDTESAPGGEAKPDFQAIIARLAKLPPLEYDRVREKEAKQLGVRVATLDVEVRKARGETAEDTSQGRAVICPEVEPWPDPVDGAELLDEVAGTLEDYLVLPEKAADAIALWAAYAHAFRAFVHSPRLNITAPQKQCGKTLVLDILETLTPRAQRTENLTTAVLFRLVHKYAPTLLIDEYDTFLRDNEELRGALNAGHKRGGVFMRCEGDNNEVRTFRVFGPVALAGIRPLPGTLHDRSIVISMTRAKPGEIRRAFDMRKTEGEHVLNRKLSRWTQDKFMAFEAAEPCLPAGVFNRVADNWRPLFAIAFCAGGGWPARAELAFESLANSEDDTESYAVMLLSDIRDMFDERRVDKLFSADIVDHLHTLEERPWPEWKNGKPITKNQLARLLRTFKIKPATKREGDTTGKGYELRNFKEAFSRYLPPFQTVTPSQPKPGAASQGFQTVTPENNVTDLDPSKPALHNDCDGVTDQKGGSEGEREVGAL